ncbi:MAG: hypothetical protein ACOX3T_00680 [Bdellovibrionota bacterium]
MDNKVLTNSKALDNKELNSKATKLDINLRATNPDNVYDIKGIIELFNLTYGSTFPNKEVYMEDFWKERIGNRFISIVAEQNSKIIGHIACCPHKEDPQNIQIIMPVVAPNSNEQEILNIMWGLVEDLAVKKSWKMAYKFITSYPKKMENTISMIGNFYDSAIYPGHKLDEIATLEAKEIHTQTSYPILYSQHTFNSELIKNDYFYPPNAYVDIITDFYIGLKIPRRLGSDKSKKTFEIYSDIKPIELKSYKHTGLCRIYITPSLLTSFTKDCIEYDTNRFSDALYYVNLLDPKCPDFCEYMETKGYSFCGIVPLIDSGDYIIYSKNISNLKDFHFTKEASENLRDIILKNENLIDENSDENSKDRLAKVSTAHTTNLI